MLFVCAVVFQGLYFKLFMPCLQVKSGNGPISSGDWKLDVNEFASMFNSKTKSIILNTPHNPIGKVFTLEELTLIADLCKKWNVLCISDEVYEWMVYKPYKHIRIGKFFFVFFCALKYVISFQDRVCKT